jgi:membrane protein implicated in regulation of membrane protease activity
VGLGSYKAAQALHVESFAFGGLDWTVEMTIGVGIFLMVLGAILAFAVQTDVPGINVNSLGVILMLIGLVAVLYSLLFWSNLTPWGRRRIITRRRLVGGTRSEVVEERPLDDGLP